MPLLNLIYISFSRFLSNQISQHLPDRSSPNLQVGRTMAENKLPEVRNVDQENNFVGLTGS